MANLEELTANVRKDGYSEINAEARVCQDIVLKAIAEGSLSHNVTVKGGVEPHKTWILISSGILSQKQQYMCLSIN